MALYVNGKKVFNSLVVDGDIDYLESWVITNKNTTMVSHLTYLPDGSLSDVVSAGQAGNTTLTLGDVSTYIGASSNWLWQATATADMKYKIYDVVNQSLSELRTATANTVILQGVPISGNYVYEIRRYS